MKNFDELTCMYMCVVFMQSAMKDMPTLMRNIIEDLEDT